MNKQLEQVKQFHEIYNVPYLLCPAIPDNRRIALRLNLMKEELREFEIGTQNRDVVECADALADLAYVLFGTVIEFGMGEIFEKIFNEVHKSNMSKLDAKGMPIYRVPDGKIMKGPNFFPPNLAPILCIK